MPWVPGSLYSVSQSYSLQSMVEDYSHHKDAALWDVLLLNRKNMMHMFIHRSRFTIVCLMLENSYSELSSSLTIAILSDVNLFVFCTNSH